MYPVQALTIADQLDAGGLAWRAYMEEMADELGPANCVHPDPDGPDEPEGGGYAATHNPFAYFHSLLDLGACAVNDVPLDALGQGPEEARDDAELCLHLAEPLQLRGARPMSGGRAAAPADPVDDDRDDDDH